MLLLSACGFQLRGTNLANLNQQIIFLHSETPYGELEKILKRDLKAAGAVMASDSERAQISLNLIRLEFDTQGVGRDSTGRANETLLNAELEFELVTAKMLLAEEVITPRLLKARRSYYQDYRNPVSEQNLQRQAREEIINELASRLARQVHWLAAN